MVLGSRQPIVADAVGADSRGLHEEANAAEGADAGGGVRGVEADHVHGGVEALGLHLGFERFAVIAVGQQQPRAFQHRPSLPAVDAHHLVPLVQEQFDDAFADVAGSADDSDFHGGELSVVSSQLSVVSCRSLFTANCQLSTDHCLLKLRQPLPVRRQQVVKDGGDVVGRGAERVGQQRLVRGAAVAVDGRLDRQQFIHLHLGHQSEDRR